MCCIRHQTQSLSWWIPLYVGCRSDDVLYTASDPWVFLLKCRVKLAHKLSMIRRQALFFLAAFTIIYFNISSSNFSVVLLFKCLHNDFPFLGRQVLLEFSLSYDGRSLLKYFYMVFEVLTRWGKGALGASLVFNHHLGLEVNCSLLQVIEPFFFKFTPNLFLDCTLRVYRVSTIAVLMLILLQIFFLRHWWRLIEWPSCIWTLF